MYGTGTDTPVVFKLFIFILQSINHRVMVLGSIWESEVCPAPPERSSPMR